MSLTPLSALKPSPPPTPREQALAYVDRWHGSDRRAVALSEFLLVLEAFELHTPSAAYSTGFGGNRSCKWLFNTLPRELEDALIGDNIDYENPIVTASSRRHAPYSILELGAGPSSELDIAAVAGIALDFGLVDGLVIPIHGPHAYLGMVSMLSGRLLDLGSMLRPAALTPREREAIALVAMGHTDDRIAARLGIAAATVRHHIDNVRQKLDATSRAEAVALLAIAGEI